MTARQCHMICGGDPGPAVYSYVRREDAIPLSMLCERSNNQKSRMLVAQRVAERPVSLSWAEAGFRKAGGILGAVAFGHALKRRSCLGATDACRRDAREHEWQRSRRNVQAKDRPQPHATINDAGHLRFHHLTQAWIEGSDAASL